MKTSSSLRIRPLATAIFCTLVVSLAPVLRAQTTATTVPVGFVTVTIAAAPNATSPKLTPVSVPLYRTADYSAAVTALNTSTQFTLSGSFTASAFVTTPHFVRVKTVANVADAVNIGKAFLISANTTTQLTVVLPSGVTNINTQIHVGDTCEVLPANTLASVFQTAPTILKSDPDASKADNVLLWNGTTWSTFYHDGFSWLNDALGFDSQDNAVIYPDEAAFVVRRGTSSVPLTIMGTVPSTTEQTDFAGGTVAQPGLTFISNRFPTNATLVSLGLQSIPGWISGGDASAVDNVLIWSGTNWGVYYFDGFNWINDALGFDPQDSTAISAASGVFIIRKGVKKILTQNLPYSL